MTGTLVSGLASRPPEKAVAPLSISDGAIYGSSHPVLIMSQSLELLRLKLSFDRAAPPAICDDQTSK